MHFVTPFSSVFFFLVLFEYTQRPYRDCTVIYGKFGELETLPFRCFFEEFLGHGGGAEESRLGAETSLGTAHGGTL